MTTADLPGEKELIACVRELHRNLRARVLAECGRAAAEDMARVDRDDEGDTIYAIDAVGDEILIESFAAFAQKWPIVLVAEGLQQGSCVLPHGTAAKDAVWRVIVDPIDGTREIMYQKRSAWILTAAAPERGDATRLSDVVVAFQTEIPTEKQHLGDELFARRGRGAEVLRWNRLTGERRPIVLAPSQSTTLAHGFAQISRFFPGGRAVMAEIDDEIIDEVVGPPISGKARSFEDQYLSTGGQLYELMAGHDRFIADLRPLIFEAERRAGRHPGIAVHPYDISTALIALELGVLITDPEGRALDCPLDTTSDVSWVGYANAKLKSIVEPVLRRSLVKRGLISQ